MDEKNLKAPDMDTVYESLREVYEVAENDILIHTNMELFRDLKNKNWHQYQLSTKRIKEINAMLAKRGQRLLDEMNKSTIKACELVGIPSTKFTRSNESSMGLLLKSAREYYKDSVNRVWKLTKGDELKQKLIQQMQVGLRNGLKVQYATAPVKLTPQDIAQGITWKTKQYGFKEYMEMAVRTAISNDIVEQQKELNATTHNVFFIVNSFGDCANDHKELQGKCYYDERWESWDLPEEEKIRIRNIIQSKRMQSMQFVQGDTGMVVPGTKIKIGWLATRPNCRHRFVPITIEQAGGDANKVLTDLNLKRGTYRDGKYEVTQKLRMVERNVRNYKAQLYQAKLVNDENLIKNYQHLVSKWQGEARKLVSEHDYLERDYRKETRDVIIQDMGVRYNWVGDRV